jgi:hypothetical protein
MQLHSSFRRVPVSLALLSVVPFATLGLGSVDCPKFAQRFDKQLSKLVILLWHRLCAKLEDTESETPPRQRLSSSLATPVTEVFSCLANLNQANP